jgi:hypothetical protein
LKWFDQNAGMADLQNVHYSDLLPQWGMQKLYKFRKRIKREIPGSRHEWGPFKTWVIEFDDGSQERRIWIDLPVWGYCYSINQDMIAWGHLTFQYCGQRGCYIGAVPIPEQQNG